VGDGVPMASCLQSCVQTGGQTDMTKLIVAFRNFPNAPDNRELSQSEKTFVKCAVINT
jgi:hypothetical protein